MNSYPQKKSSEKLLNRLIEEPELVKFIQKLEVNQLLKLIDHIGVEDSGELISFATKDQLVTIFDHVLWKNAQPGEPEKFDENEFALWLEIMLGVSEDACLNQITSMDEDLLILGLTKNILVVDLDILALRMVAENRQWEDDLVDKVLESGLSLEWSDYYIISRQYDSWDTIVHLLVALDKNDHFFVDRLLERICLISTEYIEDNGGLYNVLCSEDMLEQDLGQEREDRREKQGYIAPDKAKSFLDLACVSSLEKIENANQQDVITKSYFNSISGMFNSSDKAWVSKQDHQDSSTKEFSKIYEHLHKAEIFSKDKQRPLLDFRQEEDSGLILLKVLRFIKNNDQNLFSSRLVELNYLANVLISGDSVKGEKMLPVQAAEKALQVSNQGLRYCLRSKTNEFQNIETKALELMKKQSLVKMFRIGWRLKYGQ